MIWNGEKIKPTKKQTRTNLAGADCIKMCRMLRRTSSYEDTNIREMETRKAIAFIYIYTNIIWFCYPPKKMLNARMGWSHSIYHEGCCWSNFSSSSLFVFFVCVEYNVTCEWEMAWMYLCWVYVLVLLLLLILCVCVWCVFKLGYIDGLLCEE